MLLRLAVVAVIGGLLISVAVLYEAEPAPASCGEADDHQRAGELDLAEEGYRAILKEDSAADCAAEGLENTRCRRARRALSSRLVGEAQKMYLAVLTEDPLAQCAAEGLRNVADVRCRQAGQLRFVGLLDEAIKAYTALLDVEPRPGCVPRKLKLAQEEKKKPEEQKPAQREPSCCCCNRCQPPPDRDWDGCDR